MVNRLIFVLLFCTLNLAYVSAFGVIETTPSEISPSTLPTCTAPTPDSFRIISVSTNFISLAWKPAWVGAMQDLSILEKNELGEWIFLYASYNISGSLYTVNNLTPGKEYRFKIATRCSNGDPSELTTYIDGITLILELTIGGRMPQNPIQPNCTKIAFRNYEWVGFRVTNIIDGDNVVTNLFEFEEIQNSPISNNNFNNKLRIKRVITNHQIVATNKDGIFPINNNPVNSENPFYMRDFGNEDDSKIGRVQVIRNIPSQTLDLCIYNLDSLWLWDYPNYVFEPLVALKVVNDPMSPNAYERALIESGGNDIAVQNPFNETLNIFLPNSHQYSKNINLWLTSGNGQVLLAKEFETSLNHFSLSTGSLSRGFYILHIEINGKLQNYKLIKLE